MSQSGIMTEIRALLAQDKSTKEIIGMGYKPSTVYRAQQQLREVSDQLDPPRGLSQLVVNNNIESPVTSELKEENTRLAQHLAGLEAQVTEFDSLRDELDQARSQIEELESEASQVQVLRERLAAVEPEAQATGKVRKQSQELEAHLRHANAAMAQESQKWQEKLAAEQQAKGAAEARATGYELEVNRLKQGNQQLQQRIEQLPKDFTQEAWKLIEPMKGELEQLRECWTGHPCTICGKPTPGVISREVAGKILREGGYAHGECIKKRGWW